MSENEHEKRPVWRPTQEFPLPAGMMDEEELDPVPGWVGRLGQLTSLVVLLLIASLLIAPLVWAVRQAWGWALG